MREELERIRLHVQISQNMCELLMSPKRCTALMLQRLQRKALFLLLPPIGHQ